VKALNIDLTHLPVVFCLSLLMVTQSWTSVAGLALSVALFLGCRLIAYRQAEDVAALSARLAKVEEEAKRALNLASASAQRKAQGF
jgi:hypothetical protein